MPDSLLKKGPLHMHDPLQLLDHSEFSKLVFCSLS